MLIEEHEELAKELKRADIKQLLRYLVTSQIIEITSKDMPFKTEIKLLKAFRTKK